MSMTQLTSSWLSSWLLRLAGILLLSLPLNISRAQDTPTPDAFGNGCAGLGDDACIDLPTMSAPMTATPWLSFGDGTPTAVPDYVAECPSGAFSLDNLNPDWAFQCRHCLPPDYLSQGAYNWVGTQAADVTIPTVVIPTRETFGNGCAGLGDACITPSPVAATNTPVPMATPTCVAKTQYSIWWDAPATYPPPSSAAGTLTVTSGAFQATNGGWFWRGVGAYPVNNFATAEITWVLPAPTHISYIHTQAFACRDCGVFANTARLRMWGDGVLIYDGLPGRLGLDNGVVGGNIYSPGFYTTIVIRVESWGASWAGAYIGRTLIGSSCGNAQAPTPTPSIPTSTPAPTSTVSWGSLASASLFSADCSVPKYSNFSPVVAADFGPTGDTQCYNLIPALYLDEITVLGIQVYEFPETVSLLPGFRFCVEFIKLSVTIAGLEFDLGFFAAAALLLALWWRFVFGG